MAQLRVGILGASRIAPSALIVPAREVHEVTIAGVAARDSARAAAFAAKHGIPKAYDSYETLIADPGIDAIYNPLPNGLHGHWTVAALNSGKHVLCEKPFTANAEEAEHVAQAARSTGLVTMEAFHYRYHALTQRMLDIIASGELGAVQRIETWLCIPLIHDDIRWRLDLAGGSMMDVGCYTIHMLRTLAGAEPVVRSASAKLKSPGIDRLTTAEFDFADGRTGAITASMLSRRLLALGSRVIGTDGVLTCSNPLAPQHGHSLTVRSKSRTRKERVDRRPSSYLAQLRAFSGAVLRGEPFPTGVDDAIANMRAIDAVYQAAGLPRREPTPVG